jgi:hypothetical protein
MLLSDAFNWTTGGWAMTLRWLLLAFVMATPHVHAQDGAGEGPGAQRAERWHELPAELAAIRARQAELQATTGVELRMRDEGLRSMTGIKGVPPEFRDLVVRQVEDLEQRIEDLYPYLGFSGSESLALQRSITPDSGQHHHYFHQRINGIGLTNDIVVSVLASTGRVVDVTGNVQLDRGFRSTHALDETQALALVRQYARNVAGFVDLVENPRDEAVLLYRTWGEGQALEPWWAVHLYLMNTWLVDPGGVIHDGTVTIP